MHDLILRSPFRDLEQITSEVDSLFNSFLGRGGPLARVVPFTPATDVAETSEEIVVRMDLPGLSRDDIQVDVNEGVLTVSGERKREERTERDGFIRVERAMGRFRRSLQLPAGTDPEQIKAQFRDGVLELRVPKPSEARAHRIEISAGAEDEGKPAEGAKGE